jgi:SAM-dependent methyltransferase
MTRPFSDYDARGYRTLDVAAGYEVWSRTYDRMLGPELDLDLLATLETVPWPEVRHVLDAGCGTGRMGVWLKERTTGRIDGIDRSEAMLRRARLKGVYEGLAVADATALPLCPGRYDLGISVLAACHIAGLEALYRELAAALRNEGLFVLVDFHPFFLLRGIPTHFRSEEGEQLAIENHVHLFSDHVAAAARAGWRLREMRERLVDAEWGERAPGMAKHLHMPVSFALVWERG